MKLFLQVLFYVETGVHTNSCTYKALKISKVGISMRVAIMKENIALKHSHLTNNNNIDLFLRSSYIFFNAKIISPLLKC